MPANGPLPPGMPGYSAALSGSRFDPEGARVLLAQAGYEDPQTFPPITYTTSGYGSVGGLVTALITMWQENLGITAEPLLVEPFTYYDELFAGNTGNIFSQGWCADYPDPENFLDILFHSQSTQNIGGYANEEVDRLLEQARVEPHTGTRLALYNQIEGLIVDDMPAIFISHSLSAQLVKPRVQNYHLTPIAVPQWHLISLEQ